jgi:hypothetical protein
MFNQLIDSLNWQDEEGVKVGDVGGVEGLVIRGANFFIIIAFVLSFLALAFSFIQMITSTGDKKAAERAQKNMLWSGIGVVACFGLYAIKDALIQLFGINL